MPQDQPLEVFVSGRVKYAVLVIGLVAMAAMTVPGLRAPWITAALWVCLGYFAAEMALKTRQSSHFGRKPPYLGSAEFWWDVLGVVPVPLALIAGLPPEKAWLLASLGVFVRDLAQTIGLVVTALLFLTPIFYPAQAIPARYRIYLEINPLAWVVIRWRGVFRQP